MAMMPDDIKGEVDELISVVRNTSSVDDELSDASRRLLELMAYEAIEPIFERLRRSSDPSWVQDEMIRALGGLVSLGDKSHPESAQLMIDLLEDSSREDDIRDAAASSLGFMKAEQAVPALIQRVDEAEKGKSSEALFTCIGALGRIGDSSESVILILMKHLDHEEVFIRKAAAEALGNIGPSATSAIPALARLESKGDGVDCREARRAIELIST